MKVSRPALLFSLVCLGDLAVAIRLGLKGHRNSPEHSTLRRRGNLSGSSSLTNKGDLRYLTNITLGGAPFTVSIDTGSADLWVAEGVIPNSKDTGYRTSINYVKGGARGPIKTAALEFAGYTIPDQAFIESVRDSNTPTQQGLIGLGPNSGSNIFKKLNSNAGSTVLDRIFLQNPTTPNFITILLGRSNDPTDIFPGDLTIGEILQGYEGVLNEPKLAVPELAPSQATRQHFQVLLGADGLIGSDGRAIPTSNQQQAIAVIDTGFTFSQVPKSAADAIYSQLPGAEYHTVPGVGDTWMIPCDQEVNITFNIGGKSYPIHPMDAIIDPANIGATLKNSKGQPACLGGFQPSLKPDPFYDVILGMSFLRNVYTLINFGDFVVGSKDQREDPYIQLFATTEPSEAHSDFVKVRLNGIDTAHSGGVASGIGGASSSNSSSKRARNRIIYYIVGSAGALVVVILVSAILFFVFRSRRKAARGVYHPVKNPRPAVNMQAWSAPHPYNPPQYSAPQYR